MKDSPDCTTTLPGWCTIARRQGGPDPGLPVLSLTTAGKVTKPWHRCPTSMHRTVGDNGGHAIYVGQA